MTGESTGSAGIPAGIHPAAFVDPGAEIGEGVSIGPGSLVGPDVKIGRNTVVGANCLLEGWTEIGSGCRIYHGAVIGTEPQDLKFKNEKTYVRVGDSNTIREYATIHRATGEGESTLVGSNNFIMAYVHIAHNCVVGSNVVLANGVNMAGHVTIEDNAAVSGLTVIHQFVRIGSYSYTGGGSRIPMDIVPYIKVAGNPPLVNGLNSVGLRRSGFSADAIGVLKRAYRMIFRSNENVTRSLERIKSELPMTGEIKRLVEFIEGSERGIQL
jgi:UDP-N-acetylglucosamine acyltransferase